jgi:hypothetical protein
MPIRPWLALLPLLLALPLAAVEPARIGYGLYAGLVNPQGDLRNDMGTRNGLEGGLWLGIPLGAFEFRALLDYQSFPADRNSYRYRSTRYSAEGVEDAKLTALSLGPDLLWFPGPGRSLYLVAGGYLRAWHMHDYGSSTSTDSFNGQRVFPVDDASTRNEPALSLGGGWRLGRHFGAETRMTFSTYRKLSYNTVQLLAFYSF